MIKPNLGLKIEILDLFNRAYLTELNMTVFLMPKMNGMKVHCPERIITGHLSFSLIRNKFDALSFLSDINIKISLTLQTRLDDLYPAA